VLPREDSGVIVLEPVDRGMRMGYVILANCEGSAGLEAGRRVLQSGGPALDAVEATIREVESDTGVRTVGLGGAPNMLGQVECDACIMCGMSLRSGAVAALGHYVHAISIARAVMEKTPHVMLAGAGAERLAAEIGAERTEMLTEDAGWRYRDWLERTVPPEVLRRWPDTPLAPYIRRPGDPHVSHGTVAVLVRDADGRLAGGVSSSGWAYKYPGRVGDSPIIGAGLYVDRRYGGAACTHTGEMIIRAGTARAVVAYMKNGAGVESACREAFEDLRRLEGGHRGPVIIHAMDRDANVFVLSTGEDGGVDYWLWPEGRDAPESQMPEIEPL
jgi:beta-aspartyl-peptidase (threonine type)